MAAPPPLMVLEATGGRERVATAAWATAGLPVVVVHPRPARDCARATGQWAKPDAVEARALAPFAAVSRPTQALRALLGRRQPLRGMRTAAQHRLAGPSGRLRQDLAAPMAWLKTRLATWDAALETRRRASPRWRANDALVQRVPGMGPGCARTWRREGPELGTRKRQQSAALGGVAPLHCASGTLRGRRTLWGGRAPVRPGLSMGPLVAPRFHPQITAFSQRLLAAGQRKKVALPACRHKLVTMLKAMLKQRTSW